MADKWQSQDLNTLTLTPEPRGLCVCGKEGCGQPQHPFQQTASSCVVAMLLSRCAPHAVGLSGTDKAVRQGWGHQTCPSPWLHSPASCPGSHSRERPGLRGPWRPFGGLTRSQSGWPHPMQPMRTKAQSKARLLGLVLLPTQDMPTPSPSIQAKPAPTSPAVHLPQ